MKHRGLLLFFALTFGYTWGVGVVFALAPGVIAALAGPTSMEDNWLVRTAVCAPTLAALAVAALNGRTALRDLFAHLLRWRIGWRWYAVSTLGIAALALFARYLAGTAPGVPAPSQWPALVGAFALTLFTDPGPLGEELGWRGFALPRLLERWNGLTAAVLLGVIWGLWHLPAFFIPGLPQNDIPLWAFLLGSVGESIIMAWVFANTRSVLPTILIHWIGNTFEDLHRGAALYTVAVICLAALAIVLATGLDFGAKRDRPASA